MNEIDNPYTPGPGTSPAYLAGRESELRVMEVAFARMLRGKSFRHPLYAGLRGVGKTVLLVEARRRAREQGWLTGKVEGDASVDVLQALRLQIGGMVEELGARKRAPLTRLRKVLSSFEVSIAGTGVGVGLRAPESDGVVSPQLTELLVELGKVADDQGRCIAFFLDELHLFPNAELKAILAGLHEVNQEGLPIIFFGAGLPQLASVIQEAKTYAERINVTAIGQLSPEAARECLARPAQELGVEYEPAALDEMVRATARYPYFLQLYGEYVWNHAEGPLISGADVVAVQPEFQADLDGSFFAGRYHKASVAQRRYLLAMAETMEPGQDAVGSAAVAQTLGKSLTDVSQARDNLIRKGLIYQTERSLVGFTVPLFGDYLLRRSGVGVELEPDGLEGEGVGIGLV